jgi:hypothetical protein
MASALKRELALVLAYLRCESRTRGLRASEKRRMLREETNQHLAKVQRLANALREHQETHRC